MSRIRRRLLFVVAVMVFSPIAVFLIAAFFFAQRADYGWRPRIERPSFTKIRPQVVIDEAHNNGSTAAFWGRYWPLARLLRADGYSVVRGRDRITAASLARTRVLVIANAGGARKPQVFGINIPVRTDRKRSDPAFAPAEIDLLREWISRGGSLLLVADHAPFGEAAAPLAAALGVTMHKGFVEVPGERSDPLLFEDVQGRLGAHPIISGDRSRPVHRVMTFTGQSLDGPASASVLLRLPPDAVEDVPVGDDFVKVHAGPAQAVAFELGSGRVVVLGEGAMITAQVDHRVPFGMNLADNDNRNFALNVMRWLAH